MKMKLITILIIIFFANSSFAKTYIFISHSMKDEALKSYFKEAQKHDAILVINGLFKDDFVEMAKKIKEMKISYEIDPTLFEKYQVKMVPTIIKIEQDKVKRLSGHINLFEALKIFEEEKQ